MPLPPALSFFFFLISSVAAQVFVNLRPRLGSMMMGVDADVELVLSLRLGDRDAGSDGEAASGGGGGAVKERIARALRLYKESSSPGACEEGGLLLQVWAPVAAVGIHRRRVLATRGQPFLVLAAASASASSSSSAPAQCCRRRLLQYRAVSLAHVFSVDGDGECVSWEERGLPGRAFDAGAAEWTPNVQLYGAGEYARVSHALVHDVQGSLALPVLDPAAGRRCLAVIEMVTTAPMPCFAAEAHKLCKALQAVALRGSEICYSLPAKIPNSEATHAAMSEVSYLLATVAGAHQLPLAQAWLKCKRCSSSSSTDAVRDDSDENISLTTAGAPFHLAASADGFRNACTEHHLQAGQGPVGEAAASGSPRFCADVARRSKAAYPLAHYARLHGLAGCLAVPLLLRRFAMDDEAGQDEEEECVVLEFFLPPDCRDVDEQMAAVEALVNTVREECSGDRLKAMALSGLQDWSLEAVLALGVHTTTMADATHELNDRGDFGRSDSEDENEHLAADDQAVNIHGADQNGAEDGVSRPEKKKTGRKAGRPVGLKELQGYFSGSLKDAARSLGVCPTTMKRICRQHGISRWPFQKISKVNRALSKIRRAAIESEDCPPKPVAPSSSHPAPDLQKPCVSSAPGDTSSQGSSQEPPPLARTALPKSLLRHSNGADREVVTIKASYRGDIIRFRVPCSAGITAVKEEVAKRLGLDASGFDVKYLDDDHEWVLLSCDADFQECLDVAPVLPPSASAAAHGAGPVSPVVRLMVQEVADNLGRFCGSSD